MSILIDTGVFYAYQDCDATDHEYAMRALHKISQGRWGRVFTTDYIFDESVTLTLKRTRSHKQALRVARRILGEQGYPKLVDVLMMTGPIFRESVLIFEKYHDQGLSFTDATTIAFMHRRGIDRVLTFDDDFDGIVDRLNPANL